jgi:hypothetical protein
MRAFINKRQEGKKYKKIVAEYEYNRGDKIGQTNE